MSFLKKLQSPVALVAEGFIVGGLFFYATQGGATAPAPSQPAPPAVFTLPAN